MIEAQAGGNAVARHRWILPASSVLSGPRRSRSSAAFFGHTTLTPRVVKSPAEEWPVGLHEHQHAGDRNVDRIGIEGVCHETHLLVHCGDQRVAAARTDQEYLGARPQQTRWREPTSAWFTNG